MKTEFTEAEIMEMRLWILDCAGTSADEDAINDYTDAEVVTFVRRNYDGGLTQFWRDGNPQPDNGQPDRL